MLDCPAVYRYLTNYLRVDIGSEFLADRLKKYHKAGHLNAASGASRAGADGHKKDKSELT